MNDITLPVLDADEQRVLGSLIEKSRATPDYYPMTLNSLTAACSQKSSRNPVVQYTEDAIIRTLDTLKRKGLVSTATGGGSRAVKYKHNLAIQFPLVPADLTVLCLLLLRGPLTAGEINANSGRLYEFESIAEVQEVLSKLSEAEPPFVALTERKAGQKEGRFIHLLGESAAEEASESRNTEQYTSNLEERVAALEEQLLHLRQEFERLIS